MGTMQRSLFGAFTLALTCVGTQPVFAQAYPAKPVRFIVAFAPGGPADIIARLVGQKLSESWGQQVVVDNRAGAGGSIGNAVVAKSAADGYTVLVNTSSLAVNVSLLKDTNFHVEKDPIPVITVASRPNILV